MTRSSRRGKILTFLAVVVLPAAVLAAALVRLSSQERELASRRMDERRALLAARLGQELLVRIDRVAAAGADSAVAPAIVARARFVDGRLQFPWDVRSARPAGPGSEFRRLIGLGEAAEFDRKAWLDAAASYARAGAVAADSTERGEALLGEARALRRAGRPRDAAARYAAVGGFSTDVRDAEGVPLALYAAEGLIAGPTNRQQSNQVLLDVARAAPSLGLTPLYMLRDLAAGSGVALDSAVPRRIAEVEALRALETALPALGAIRGNSDAGAAGSWTPFGTVPWLVAVRGAGEPSINEVTIVRPAAVLEAISADTGGLARAARAARLTTAMEQGAETLGPGLGGLRVRFTDPAVLAGAESPLGGRRFVVVLAVLPLLAGAVAWLVWRDLRREAAAVELRSQFISSVSHELKTPLTSIRMFAETLLLGRPQAESRKLEYLETIVHESERLSRLINNVLDFSRIDRGEQRYRFSRTDIAEVVRDSARAMSYPLQQAGFEVSIDIPDGLPQLEADRDALTQAVLNLISNAIKFSGEGRRIELRVATENGNACVRVRDYGRGISAADRARIFERFYRAPDVEADGIPGTGLGLALVAHVAEAHGGRVDVDSAPGAGSTFTLRLPVEPNS